MQFWMETVSKFPERVGKYLICPINSSTKVDLPIYRILKEPISGDIVFHYILSKAYPKEKKASAIVAYSTVACKFKIQYEQDSLCDYLPPYRKIELVNHTKLRIPVTTEILLPYRNELEKFSLDAAFLRSPFDKNFKIKQMYLSRIPEGFIKIFEELSETHIQYTETA